MNPNFQYPFPTPPSTINQPYYPPNFFQPNFPVYNPRQPYNQNIASYNKNNRNNSYNNNQRNSYEMKNRNENFIDNEKNEKEREREKSHKNKKNEKCYKTEKTDKYDKKHLDSKNLKKSITTCQICEKKKKKYKCPACGIFTCSLICIRDHKIMKKCSGIYKQERFLSKNELNEKEGVKDYNYLNKILSGSEKIRKNLNILNKKGNGSEALRFKLLRVFAKKLNNIKLEVMPFIMTRHRENLSFFYTKMKKIFWTVEILLFSQTKINKPYIRALSSESICEDVCLEDLLKKISIFDSEFLVKTSKGLESENIIRYIQEKELLIIYKNEKNNEKTEEKKTVIENNDKNLEENNQTCIQKNEKENSAFEVLNLEINLNSALSSKVIIEYPKLFLVFAENLEVWKKLNEKKINP